MRFSSLFIEIHELKTINEARQKAFLLNWLEHSFRREKVKTPALQLLARNVALELAKDDNTPEETLIQRAFEYLYPSTTIQMVGKALTEAHFLARKFLVKPGAGTVTINSDLKYWGNTGSLIVLYEAALAEVSESNAPDWIKTEALMSLEHFFDLSYDNSRTAAQQRINRLAALMLDPKSTGLPSMQAFWQAYQDFYGCNHLTPELSTEFKYDRDMGLQLSGRQPIDSLLPENPNAETISEFKKAKTEVVLYQKMMEDYNNRENETQFLAQRQHTTSTSGYTADPYSPTNLFCAHIALSLVDKTKNNPREQFWTLLYPHLQGVYLGTQDIDWPNYGEALLFGNQLINYRKLALMAQYRDAHKVLTGQNEDKAVDRGLVAALQKMPGYQRLPDDVLRSITRDRVFWGSTIPSEYGRNVFEFFTKTMEVLDKYRAGHEKNRHLENEMSEEGVEAFRPFLKHFERTVKALLLNYKNANMPTMNILIDFDERMTNYKKSCFNAAYKDLKGALTVLEDTLKAVKFEESCFAAWDEKLCVSLYQNNCIASPPNQEIIELCLNSITDNLTLLKWIEIEAKQGTPLQIHVIAKRFLELAGPMTATELFDFILTHFPKADDVLFADQIGHEDSAQFGQAFFITKLFNNGIDESRLQTLSDYRCALKLHIQFGVKGKEETIKRCIAHFQCHHYSCNEFKMIEQILVLLISDSASDDVRITQILKGVTLPTVSKELARFFNLFENSDFPKLIQYLVKYNMIGMKGKTYDFTENSACNFQALEFHSTNRQYIKAIMGYMKDISPSNRKKNLVLFEHVLPYLLGPNLPNSNLPELGTFFNLFSREEMTEIPEMAVIFMLKAQQRKSVKEHHVANALGMTLRLILKAITYSAGVLEGFMAIAQQGEQPAFDSVDRNMNTFRQQMQTIHSSADLGVLLSYIDHTDYNNILKFFPIIAITKSYDDWALLLKPLSSLQQKVIFSYHTQNTIITFDNMIKILPYISNEVAKRVFKMTQFKIESLDDWKIALSAANGDNWKPLIEHFNLQHIFNTQQDITATIRTLFSGTLIINDDNSAMISAIHSVCSWNNYPKLLEAITGLPEANQINIITQLVRNVTLMDFLKHDKNIYTEKQMEFLFKAIASSIYIQAYDKIIEFCKYFDKTTQNYFDISVLSLPAHITASQRLDSVPPSEKLVCLRAFIYKNPSVIRDAEFVITVLLENGAENFIELLTDFLSKRPELINNEFMKECHKKFRPDTIAEILIKTIEKHAPNQLHTELLIRALITFLESNKNEECTRRLAVLTALKDKFKGSFASILSYEETRVRFALSLIKRDELTIFFECLDTDQLYHLVQLKNRIKFTTVIYYIESPDTRKALINRALHEHFLTTAHIKRMLPLPEPRGAEILECLGDTLARFKAIYPLLADQSSAGYLLRLGNVTIVNNLELNDLEGWKRFFASPDMSETTSLRFQSFEIARRFTPEEREVGVKNAIATRNFGNRVSNLFFSQSSQRPLSPELNERIRIACNQTAPVANVEITHENKSLTNHT